MDVPEEYSSDSILIDSCVASPGTLEGLVPVNSNDPFWPLINEGCLNDHTVEILPRGENGEIRFSFEGFTFHSYEEQAVSFLIFENFSFFENFENRVMKTRDFRSIFNANSKLVLVMIAVTNFHNVLAAVEDRFDESEKTRKLTKKILYRFEFEILIGLTSSFFRLPQSGKGCNPNYF